MKHNRTGKPQQCRKTPILGHFCPHLTFKNIQKRRFSLICLAKPDYFPIFAKELSDLDMAKKLKTKKTMVYPSYFDENVFYTSKKFPLFEYIFNKYNPNRETKELIQFSLSDINEAYSKLGIKKPTSTSNTVLDLTRKRHPISYRLPESIYSLGYDLRKKTGLKEDTKDFKYAGEFVFVGIGKELDQWLTFPPKYDDVLAIESSSIPNVILPFLRKDESAILSVSDYLDIPSQILHAAPHQVKRVQHPIKWQPNEIDGCYVCEWEDEVTLYPVEAKALSTGDDINIYQMLGGINMLHKRLSAELKQKNKVKVLRNLNGKTITIQPLAAVMRNNEIHFAFFEKHKLGSIVEDLKCVKATKISLTPYLPNWIK